MIEMSFKLIVDEKGLHLTSSSKSSAPKNLEAQLMTGLVKVVKTYFQGAAQAIEQESKAAQLAQEIEAGTNGANGTGKSESESEPERIDGEATQPDSRILQFPQDTQTPPEPSS